MKILLTGFDPFNNATINPASQIVNQIDRQIGNNTIIPLIIPTSFSRSFESIKNAIYQYNPDVIICLGQAGGRKDITIEKIGINLKDCPIADNDGYIATNETIVLNGEDGLFASIDIIKLTNALKDNNIPASISYSAGTFVCNYVLYPTLQFIKHNNLDIKAGFIHVPFLPEQTSEKPNIPSMPLETMVNAINIVLENI